MIRVTITTTLSQIKLPGKEFPLTNLPSLNQRTRSLALALALAALPAMTGCGGSGSADVTAPAFQSAASFTQSAASPTPSNHTPISFDELSGLLASDDPPFS